MTVATTLYGHQTAPWDSPASWGVQAFIEYNGLVLNDRHQADRIRVFSITGLDEPDSTDAREVIPGDDGEVVYDGQYRGRTIIMTGRIEAGSLGVLRRLERDFKAAFAPLVEAPMKFRWFDVYDSFDDPNTLQNFTAVTGSNFLPAVNASGGVLHWQTTGNMMLIRTGENRAWSDHHLTLRMVVGSVADNSTVYLVPSYKDVNNYVKVNFTEGGGGTSISISSVVGGTVFQLASQAVTGIVQGQSVWLRSRRDGDYLTAELWTSAPTTNALPPFSVTGLLTGADADVYGDQILTQAGFGADTATTNWAFDDFRIGSVSPCDVILSVKKMPNGLSIKDSQDSMTRFVRPFQLTLRSSWPYLLCAAQSRGTLIPTSISVPLTGVGFPLTFPLRFTKYSPGAVTPQNNNILSVMNRGTAPARPQIVVYGSVTGGFALVNLTNGQVINWSGSLSDGDYLVIDCAAKTFVNSAGTNQLQYFSSTDPRWMIIEPGWNDIYFAGTGFTGNTKVVTYWRGSFV